ncbi:MAG TPA: sensor histidine kinase KdpD [Bryobacteraceae bacterium]|nr:sensor histidine kinase KdpD [Bryobacteraceae bacterium]
MPLTSDSGRRGKLKIFLGYAAGVGKTYQMLEEANELKRSGRDVVIGYFEPHGRPDTIAKAEALEIVPRRVTAYKGASFADMDTEAILARHPEVCVVDEFPHTNIPGSERKKRWQDVSILLDHGIDVLTTMNIQHLESLNDQVWQISGIRVRETIPDWVLKQADEVVMIDLTPRALLNRLERGVVYSPDKAARAKANFFKEETLVALRELALRETAHEVNIRHLQTGESSLERHEDVLRGRSLSSDVGPERILIHVTSDPASARLIRRGKRVADYLGADCLAVSILKPGRHLKSDEREKLEQHLNFARNMQIETRELQGEDIAEVLVEFARRNQVTQIFLSHPDRRKWPPLLRRTLDHRVVHLARDMRVVIVADRQRTRKNAATTGKP